MESGSNASGNWIKFYNGTMIVTQRFTRTYNTNIQQVAGYYGYANIFPEFPVPFVEVPVVNVTLEDNDAISIVPYNTTKNNASSANAYVYSFVECEKTVNINVTAIGKWK